MNLVQPQKFNKVNVNGLIKLKIKWIKIKLILNGVIFQDK